MVPRSGGSIFFTSATTNLRGGVGYTPFAGAKLGLHAVAQSMARELGPKNIHVVHLVIDANGCMSAFVMSAEQLEPDRLANPDPGGPRRLRARRSAYAQTDPGPSS
jgi:NAD(P)-dependent dehydrogenase (short-subunit alcohol dehydrogenase family)